MRHFPKADAEAVGEPLFLTPYIEAGQLEEARQLARVDPALLEVIYRREKKIKFRCKEYENFCFCVWNLFLLYAIVFY